jgi:hypothetical protein
VPEPDVRELGSLCQLACRPGLIFQILPVGHRSIPSASAPPRKNCNPVVVTNR